MIPNTAKVVYSILPKTRDLTISQHPFKAGNPNKGDGVRIQ